MDPLVEPTEDFLGGDIVVDLPYRDLVAHVLEKRLEPPVCVTGDREDTTLGLALLSLDGVDEYAAAHPPPAQPKAGPLDTVLSAVRGYFAGKCGGWTPEMGKNRQVGCIIGFPQSKPLASGSPDPATKEEYEHLSPATAGRGVRVGVLDTGLFLHPALAGHVLAPSADLFEPGTTPEPEKIWAGHATFVAGLIAARAPGAEIIMAKVLDNETGKASAWETAVAMARFADRNIDVLNLSLGCLTKDGRPPLVLRRAVEVLGARMVIVAAAGNHGKHDICAEARRPVWPAALPGVLAVGAAQDPELGDKPELAEISPRLPWVDCIAPGMDVVSTYLSGVNSAKGVKGVNVLVHPDECPGTDTFKGFARWRGTSFAAATVSGAIAKDAIPGQVTARQSLQRLLDTPNPVVRRYDWRDDDQCAGRPNGGKPGHPGPER